MWKLLAGPPLLTSKVRLKSHCVCPDQRMGRYSVVHAAVCVLSLASFCFPTYVYSFLKAKPVHRIYPPDFFTNEINVCCHK